MTDNVIHLNRGETEMHLSGQARCLDCRTEWEAVAPVGTCYLECPQCGTKKGVMRNPVGGAPEAEEAEWTCNCGCDVFKLISHRTGTFKAIRCLRCGLPQTF